MLVVPSTCPWHPSTRVTSPAGNGPLGNLQSTRLNMNRDRRAYYFRKTLDIPGHCFVGLQIALRALDGAVSAPFMPEGPRAPASLLDACFFRTVHYIFCGH